MDAQIDLSVPGPSLLDPRLLVLVPTDRRPALTALWRLEARLFALVAQHREPMLAQIKLSWWRDRLAQIAARSDDLPRGEPLLAELVAQWRGNAALVPLVDAYEAILLADSDGGRMAAADGLANAMRAVMGGSADTARIWALARAGQLAQEQAAARLLWQAAAVLPQGGGNRGDTADTLWRVLDRWGALVARAGGRPSRRSQAWLLLRAGLGW